MRYFEAPTIGSYCYDIRAVKGGTAAVSTPVTAVGPAGAKTEDVSQGEVGGRECQRLFRIHRTSRLLTMKWLVPCLAGPRTECCQAGSGAPSKHPQDGATE
eukprot:7231338-Pyramimonas_sp.AAC.1